VVMLVIVPKAIKASKEAQRRALVR
jgi:hypothetical protein